MTSLDTKDIFESMGKQIADMIRVTLETSTRTNEAYLPSAGDVAPKFQPPAGMQSFTPDVGVRNEGQLSESVESLPTGDASASLPQVETLQTPVAVPQKPWTPPIDISAVPPVGIASTGTPPAPFPSQDIPPEYERFPEMQTPSGELPFSPPFIGRPRENTAQLPPPPKLADPFGIARDSYEAEDTAYPDDTNETRLINKLRDTQDRFTEMIEKFGDVAQHIADKVADATRRLESIDRQMETDDYE